MLLTGKAKDDFYKYFIKYQQTWELKMYVIKNNEYTRNCLIIDWFDSVGIQITIIAEEKQFTPKVSVEYKIEVDMFHRHIETRKEAIKQAIIKANEIYNNDKS